ncbi:hypothetical protein AB1Y20_018925 [Prymnesium parvum]|uniref:Uncharacterized protein n=1 Tax=Prymnesium parvum TaxID=97485 RepID=A0AB34JQ02_PRYPA
MRSTTPRLALLLLLPTLAATQRSSCGPPSSAAALHAAGYAPDHLNYLCTNWTRPTPLPCSPARTGWQPRWGKRFVITAWWPPLPSDYEAYADAGFNLALLRGDTWLNRAQEQAYAEGRGPEWHATHDGLFEAVLEESRLLAEKGVMSVFTQVQLVGDQQPRATQAYGNRTGGVVRAGSNITTHAYQSFKNHFDTGDVRSYMETVPEVEYFLSELERRNISHRFGGLFLADDTVTQASQEPSHDA